MSAAEPNKSGARAWILGAGVALAGLLLVGAALFWLVRALSAPEPTPTAALDPGAPAPVTPRSSGGWHLPFFGGSSEDDAPAVDPKSPYAKTKITGRVFDANTNEPIAGASIRVAARSGSPHLGPQKGDGSATFRSGADGSFSLLGVPPGTFELRVSAQGYAARVTGFKKFSAIEDDSGFEIGLVRAAPIVGRVTDAEGKPVAGAAVHSNDPLMTASATTDEDGRYLIEGAPNLPLALCVEHPSYVPAVVVAPMENDGSRVADAVLQTGEAVVGFVHDEFGPVSGAKVQLAAVDTPELSFLPSAPATAMVVSGADGHFNLRTAGGARSTYRVEAEGYRAATFTVGAEPSVDVVLERGARVAGRALRSDGSPAAGTTIDMIGQFEGPRSVDVGPDGSFAFEACARNGWFALSASHPELPPTHLRIEGPSEQISLLFQAAGKIQGTVVDAETGTPIQEYEAVALGPITQPSSAVSVSGALELDQLAPGSYRVLVRAAGHSVERVENVIVSAGATTQIGELRLKKTGSISGRVTGGYAARVIAEGDNGTKQASLVDEDGSFLLSELGPGVYRLEGLGSGLRGHVDGVRVGTGAEIRDVVIPLVPSGSSPAVESE
ncbi:MAG: carboxypeptidase regulatory-like domain-containing protein [Myxococcota bacterium]